MNLLNEYIDEMMTEINGKIIPGNIKKGVTIFNTEGNLDAMDTSDATAVTKDIINGKTAYVNGEKITGNIQERTAEQTPMKTAATTITENNDRNRFGMSGVPTALQTYAFRPNAKVEVEADKDKVANAIGLTPEKLVKGNTILGIEGTAETGGGDVPVKLFNTKDDMLNDTTAKEGDLAVVYRSEIQNIKDGDVITSMTFPKTVVFDTAITTSYSSRLRNSTEPRIYLDMQLSSTSFRVRDRNGKIPTITYKSSDGITYTRTDTNKDTYEIGETTISSVDEHICKFIQVGGKVFDGLYECDNVTIDYTYPIYNLDTNLVEGYVSLPKEVVDLNPTFIIPSKIEDGILKSGTIYKNTSRFYKLRDIGWVGTIQTYSGAETGNVTKYDLTDLVLGEKQTLVANKQISGNGQNTDRFLSITPDGFSKITKVIVGFSNTFYGYDYGSTTSTECPIVPGKEYGSDGISTSFNTNTYKKQAVTGLKWLYATTQLTLAKTNELLPGKIAYGKNGLITGDGSIYDNLDTDYVLSNFFGLTSYKSNAYGYIPHNLAKVNYLKRQSGGQYVLASVKQNIPYESTETHYSSIWNDAGTIEFRMIYNNFYLYDKNGNVLYDFRSDHAIISDTIDTSVVHFENDILCLLVCTRTACVANSNSAFILKIDMSNGTVNDIVGDTFSINVSDYTNEVYGGYMANAGIAFVSLAAEKTSSPYTQYSAVHIYDAIYDNLFYLEYVTSNSSSIGIDMIYPQIVQSQGDKLFIVLSQNGNTQSSKLYEYNRKTKISTLLSTKTSRLSLGNTSSKTIGTVIDCGGYLYTPDNHNEGQFYRYSKSSTTVPTPTETVPEPTATRFVGTRYAQGDKLYNSNTGEICTVDTSDTIPIINLVDKLAFDNYYCTVSDGSYRSYVRKEIEKITNDYVDIYGIVYTDSFKCRLTRYTEGTPDDYDVAALNVYKTTNVVQTYLLGVTGTYEPNYTELGTISPTEYDTAVNTSNDILGNTTV